MTPIKKEIPTGTIDGVNKVFTLDFEPYFIDDMWFDGAIYTDFSFSGNVITLGDAPTASLYIDYTPNGSQSGTAGSVTLGRILTRIWDNLGTTSNSTTFSRQRLIDDTDILMQDIIKGQVVDIVNGRTYRCSDMYFLKDTITYNYKAGSTTSEIISVGDNTVSCDTTYLQSSGYAWISGEIINYTGIDEDGLTGVTGISVEHYQGEKIVQMYTLPDSVDRVLHDKVKQIRKNTDYTKYDIPYNNEESFTKYFSIYKDDEKQLLKVEGLEDGDNIEVKYIVSYTPMTEDTDISILPTTYGLSVVADVVSGILGYRFNIPGGEKILRAGYSNLQTMFQGNNGDVRIVKQTLKPVARKFYSMRYTEIND